MKVGRSGWIAAAALCLAPAVVRAQDTVLRADGVDASRSTASTASSAADTLFGSVGTVFRASPLLPFEHWAVQAARRAEAMGLTRFFPAQRSVPRAQVARALEDAARDAATPAVRRMAEGWAARFREEFPEYADAEGRSAAGVSLLGSHAAVGVERWTGRLSPAVGYQGSRAAPVALPEVSDPRASLLAGVSTPWASLSGEGVYRGGDAVLRQWDAAVGFGAFQLSVGRAPLGYGWGRTGGIVYSTPDPLPRVELQSTRPFRLPWVLRRVGPVTVHTFAGPVADPARHPTDPGLWGMRVAAQPHPRLTLGINRGSMFGGDGDPTTVGRLAKMLVGVVHSTFENQVLSFDGRYRLPTERVLPATAYLEWGADDAAGALDETPGRVIGVFFPALPGAPQVGAGGEYTYFKAWCCGHGPWYLNYTFPGNWAARGRPLGHPLGGEGAEYAAYAQADLWDARLRLDARGFVRDRSDRSLNGTIYRGGGNLFTPQRAGRSTGGSANAALRLAPRAEAKAAWMLDSGDGWREQSLAASLAWTF